MKMSNVIQALGRRREFLALSLHEWNGPLHSGAHGHMNCEYVALGVALDLAKDALLKRHLEILNKETK